MEEIATAAAGGKRGYVFEIVKAVIVALVISLVLVLIAAFIIKFFNIPSGAVPVINQVIRSLGILLGCMIALRRPGHGWLRGIITGAAYSALAFVLFSLLGDGFVWNITVLNNVAIGTAAGLISGIIAMLIRRN